MEFTHVLQLFISSANMIRNGENNALENCLSKKRKLATGEDYCFFFNVVVFVSLFWLSSMSY